MQSCLFAWWCSVLWRGLLMISAAWIMLSQNPHLAHWGRMPRVWVKVFVAICCKVCIIKDHHQSVDSISHETCACCVHLLQSRAWQMISYDMTFVVTEIVRKNFCSARLTLRRQLRFLTSQIQNVGFKSASICRQNAPNYFSSIRIKTCCLFKHMKHCSL